MKALEAKARQEQLVVNSMVLQGNPKLCCLNHEQYFTPKHRPLYWYVK